MAIIHSCCCWRSLRTGSYAAAIYTMVLFSIIIITMAHFIHEEWRYLKGDLNKPGAKSYLETDTISHTTVVFNIIVLGCSSLGFLSSILLILGIYIDKKYLLLPWIITMLSETAIEIIHTGYLFFLETMNFNPITAILFTLDFFLIIVNLYSIICVISQYQEYLAGRGTAIFDYDDRLAHVQYTAGPHTTTTATSQAGRSRRVSNAPSARAEPEESVAEKPVRASVLVKTHKTMVKKHVQFPDEKTCADEDSSDAPEGAEAPSVVPSLWMEREPAPSESAPPER